MAENGSGATNVNSSTSQSSTEKRKFEERGDGEPLEKKKITIKFGIQKKTEPSEDALSKQQQMKIAPVKLSLSSQKKKDTVPVKPQTASIAKAFNQDESDDEDEMPFEAKMRMKNIGRETPTAAGPNSFGKGRLGFVDRTKALEREIQQQMDELGEA